MTRWVSLEGVNGVGKTYFARRLTDRLGPHCRLVAELTDATDTTAEVVIGVLTAAGGTFLRTNHPLTETFTLAALKVREYERIRQLATAPALVLEDRGVDTVAVYQAVILSGPDADPAATMTLAERIAAIAARWRPDPDLTVLLVDDLARCIGRFETRTGQRVSGADRHMLARVANCYLERATADPLRWRICSRSGRGDDEVLDQLEAWCRALAATAEDTAGRP